MKEVDDFNRSKFEIEAETLDQRQEVIEHIGFSEDAWASLCPEAYLE